MMFNSQKILFLFTFLFLVSNLSAQKLEYSRDGQTLAVNWAIDIVSGDDFSQFLLYDVKTGKLKSSLNSAETPNSVIFSNDSKTLVIGERLLLEKIGTDENGKLSLLENPVSIENLSIDRKFQDQINADFLGLALSPDGKTLYKLFPNFLNAYTFPDLKFQPEKSRAIKLNEKTTFHEHFIAISPDASVVVESEYAKMPSLVIKENGKPAVKTALTKNEEGTAFEDLRGTISQNNETLMLKSTDNAGLYWQISFFDLKKHALIGVFSTEAFGTIYENNLFPVEIAAISPNGKKAAINYKSYDEDGETLFVTEIYDIAAKKSVSFEVKSADYMRFAESIAFSPDSKQIATLSTKSAPGSIATKVQIWDAETGKLIREF